ncbi:hypothetical protein D3C72_2303170 [compost metagenome]
MMFPLRKLLQALQDLFMFQRLNRRCGAAPTLRKWEQCHCPCHEAGLLQLMHPR